MSNTAIRRGREVVEEYAEAREVSAYEIDTVVSLVRDVLLWVEEDFGADMIEYVCDSAAEGL